MLYNDINKHQMTINWAQIYIDKIAEKVTIEKVKTRAIFQQKEFYKELKMGMDPKDDAVVAAVLQETKKENLELRQQLKMPGVNIFKPLS